MSMSPYASRNRAFTLIELLIVITIIGILAVALIPRLTGGPARARDAQRKSDMQQISTALEFYNTDNNTYPSHATMTTNNCVAQLTLSSSYISAVPSDPNLTSFSTAPSGWCSSNGAYTYISLNTDTDAGIEGYLLLANLENNEDRGQGTFSSSFSIPAWGTGMLSASSATVSTLATYCYNNTANCPASTTDVIYVIGR